MEKFVPVETVHRTLRRTRLRIGSKRGSDVFFNELARRLSACDGVQAVRARSRTATVVIWHKPGFCLSTINFPALGLSRLREAKSQVSYPLVRRESRIGDPRKAAAAPDRHVRLATSVRVDLPSIAFQLIMLAIAPRPGVAIIRWVAEALLKTAIRSSLAPETSAAAPA